jgi:hypothetical protein
MTHTELPGDTNMIIHRNWGRGAAAVSLGILPTGLAPRALEHAQASRLRQLLPRAT